MLRAIASVLRQFKRFRHSPRVPDTDREVHVDPSAQRPKLRLTVPNARPRDDRAACRILLETSNELFAVNGEEAVMGYMLGDYLPSGPLHVTKLWGQYNDDNLAVIGQLHGLGFLQSVQAFHISGGLTDRGLDQIHCLAKLETLDLDDAWNITDSAVQRLWKNLPSLIRVKVSCEQIGDLAFQGIDQCRELIDVDVSWTQLTNIGFLDCIAVLPQLERVNVTGAKVSEAGVAQMRAKRPDIEVVTES